MPASSSISSCVQSTSAIRCAISSSVGTRGFAERKSHSPHSAAHVGSNAPSVRRAIAFARRSTCRRSAGTATASPPARRFTAESGDDSFHSLIRASTSRNTPNTASASAAASSPAGTVTRTAVAITSSETVTYPSPGGVAVPGSTAEKTTDQQGENGGEPGELAGTMVGKS